MRLLPPFPHSPSPDPAPPPLAFATNRASRDNHPEARPDVAGHYLYSAPAVIAERPDHPSVHRTLRRMAPIGSSRRRTGRLVPCQAKPVTWHDGPSRASVATPRSAGVFLGKAAAYARTAVATGTIGILIFTAMACGSDDATDRRDSAPDSAAPAADAAAKSSDTNAGAATSRQSDSSDTKPPAGQVTPAATGGSSSANATAPEEPTTPPPTATPTTEPTHTPELSPTPTVVPTPTVDPYKELTMLLTNTTEDGIKFRSALPVTEIFWADIVAAIRNHMADLLSNTHPHTYGFYDREQMTIIVHDELMQNLEITREETQGDEITISIQSHFDHRIDGREVTTKYRISATGVVKAVKPSKDDAATSTYVDEFDFIPQFVKLIDGPVIWEQEGASK